MMIGRSSDRSSLVCSYRNRPSASLTWVFSEAHSLTLSSISLLNVSVTIRLASSSNPSDSARRRSPGDDVRSGQNLAFLLAERNHDDEDAVLGKQFAVSQHDIADVADTKSIDQHVARWHFAASTRVPVLNLDRVAVVHNENVVRIDSDRFRQHAMLAKHAIFSVNRDEIFRAHQIEHQFQVFLVAVTRYVCITAGTGTVNDIGSEPEQFIDRATYIALVARNRRGCNDNRIARHNIHLAMR